MCVYILIYLVLVFMYIFVHAFVEFPFMCISMFMRMFKFTSILVFQLRLCLC